MAAASPRVVGEPRGPKKRPREDTSQQTTQLPHPRPPGGSGGVAGGGGAVVAVVAVVVGTAGSAAASFAIAGAAEARGSCISRSAATQESRSPGVAARSRTSPSASFNENVAGSASARTSTPLTSIAPRTGAPGASDA